jgi:nucleotide-binding universal stress UspA family protein
METKLFRRILVAWDGSPGSVAAFHAAVALTGGDGGHVVALCVLRQIRHAETAEERERELTAHRRRAEAEFAPVRDRLALGHQARMELHIVEGDNVAKVLGAYATEHGYGLIVAGRHGEGGPLHAALGHVPRDLARSATQALLIV